MEVQVIEKMNGRIDRITGTIINTRLKVGAYCRVSTNSEDQKNSYQSQVQYYTKKINDNVKWSFVDIYADEAISGTQDYKRSDFMRMIQEALDGKLDIIITKSISRFARNTLDTLKYVRMLKEKNIAVIFEEENINTLEMAGELLLTILSSVAQQESETISSHVTLGIEMKMKRGEMVGYNRAYGYNYNKDSKNIVINKEEAPLIEYIYNRYCEGIGAKTISKELTNMKIKTPRGYEKWAESTILGILKNPIYKGDLLMGKTYTTDAITHKRVKNYGEKNQYYVKEHHEAIVSEEIWSKTQEILNKRSSIKNGGRMKGNYSRKYPFSSRIFCGYCGAVYSRRNWAAGTKNEKRVWQCMNYIKEGMKSCQKCKAIREDVLENCFIDAYKILCNNDKDIVGKFMEKVRNTTKDISNDSIITNLKRQVEELDKKISCLVDLHLEGNVDETVYLIKKEKFNTKKEKLLHDIELLTMEKENYESAEIGLEKIEKILKSNDIMQEFDKDVFEAIIKKVIIGEEDDPLAICFVLKSGEEYIQTLEERQMDIKENTQINYDTIVNFFSFQKVVNFEKAGIGKVKKNLNKVRVKVVYEANSMI